MITIDQNALSDCIRDAVREEMKLYLAKVDKTIGLPQQQPASLLTKKEMAEELDISLVSLTEWMKQGRIPYKQMGKRIYFNKEEVFTSMSTFNSKGGKR